MAAITGNITIQVTNNLDRKLEYSLLGGTGDPTNTQTNPRTLYDWDLATEPFTNKVVVNIQAKNVGQTDFITYTAFNQDGTISSIQQVANLLNTLNLGVFNVDGDKVFTLNDEIVFGNLSVLIDSTFDFDTFIEQAYSYFDPSGVTTLASFRAQYDNVFLYAVNNIEGFVSQIESQGFGIVFPFTATAFNGFISSTYDGSTLISESNNGTINQYDNLLTNGAFDLSPQLVNTSDNTINRANLLFSSANVYEFLRISSFGTNINSSFTNLSKDLITKMYVNNFTKVDTRSDFGVTPNCVRFLRGSYMPLLSFPQNFFQNRLSYQIAGENATLGITASEDFADWRGDGAFFGLDLYARLHIEFIGNINISTSTQSFTFADWFFGSIFSLEPSTISPTLPYLLQGAGNTLPNFDWTTISGSYVDQKPYGNAFEIGGLRADFSLASTMSSNFNDLFIENVGFESGFLLENFTINGQEDTSLKSPYLKFDDVVTPVQLPFAVVDFSFLQIGDPTGTISGLPEQIWWGKDVYKYEVEGSMIMQNVNCGASIRFKYGNAIANSLSYNVVRFLGFLYAGDLGSVDIDLSNNTSFNNPRFSGSGIAALLAMEDQFTAFTIDSFQFDGTVNFSRLNNLNNDDTVVIFESDSAPPVGQEPEFDASISQDGFNDTTQSSNLSGLQEIINITAPTNGTQDVKTTLNNPISNVGATFTLRAGAGGVGDTFSSFIVGADGNIVDNLDTYNIDGLTITQADIDHNGCYANTLIGCSDLSNIFYTNLKLPQRGLGRTLSGITRNIVGLFRLRDDPSSQPQRLNLDTFTIGSPSLGIFRNISTTFFGGSSSNNPALGFNASFEMNNGDIYYNSTSGDPLQIYYGSTAQIRYFNQTDLIWSNVNFISDNSSPSTIGMLLLKNGSSIDFGFRIQWDNISGISSLTLDYNGGSYVKDNVLIMTNMSDLVSVSFPNARILTVSFNGSNSLNSIVLNGNKLDSLGLNALLNEVNAFGTNNGILNYANQTTGASPTIAGGGTSYNNLISRGWSIIGNVPI